VLPKVDSGGIRILDVSRDRRRRRMSRPKTLKGILKQIDEFLLMDNDESIGLWRVMTALRGPDYTSVESLQDKWVTTAVIRAKAFPKSTAKGAIWVDVNTKGTLKRAHDLALDRLRATSTAHFYSHMLDASGTLMQIYKKEEEPEGKSDNG
jgi:hypothetical protein